jgi:hypothetical protein
MSTRQMRKRLAKVQEKVSPDHDGLYTWEELCRLVWRSNKQRFIELANKPGSMSAGFVEQFEREDAERAARR